jgi:hypothetical protein
MSCNALASQRLLPTVRHILVYAYITLTYLFACYLVVLHNVRAVAAEALLSQQLKRWQLKHLLEHVLSLASFRSHSTTAQRRQHTKASQCQRALQ